MAEEPEDQQEEEIVQIEEIFEPLAAQILGGPAIINSWVLTFEAVDENMGRHIHSFVMADQPPWITKMLHREALDNDTVSDIAEGIMYELSGGDDDGGEES
jgi:hypothetical protein